MVKRKHKIGSNCLPCRNRGIIPGVMGLATIFYPGSNGIES